jgi:hypothetical protein
MIIILTISFSLAAIELDEFLELEVKFQKIEKGETINYVTSALEEAAEFCVKFPRNNQDIKKYFVYSAVVEEVPKIESECIATGVARNGGGDVVDFEVFQGGFGCIAKENVKTYFECAEKSKCCEVLPHVCDKK